MIPPFVVLGAIVGGPSNGLGFVAHGGDAGTT